MGAESRANKVVRNTIMGVINNLSLVALNLISRKMFLKYIGIEYLSIGQVISNMLGILAFSELGVTNSVLYMLYKPVAENDTEKIARIIGSYKRINRAIGVVLLVLGMACIPFLDKFIHTSVPASMLTLIFAMNLISTVSTYFCSYRQVLINANQSNYIVSGISLAVNFLSIIVQCVVIYFTHNYLLYLTVAIVMGVFQNLVLHRIAGRLYPYLREYGNYKLAKNEAKVLLEHVKSMFSVKLCGIVINNTDNVLVSLINTLMVGYCANYTMISTRIHGIVSIFHNSVVYSLGIASVGKSAEEKYRVFKRIKLINTGIAGITSVLLGTLWDDFIVLWLGEEYRIPQLVMYSILLNYTWTVITASIWIFRDTNGLFVYVKRMLIANAVLNLVLSILLGKIIGVAGVYFATVIADVLTDFWYDSKLVYKRLFERKNSMEYMAGITFNTALILFIVYLMKHLFVVWPVTVSGFLTKGILAAGIYVIVFGLLYGRSPAFKEILKLYVLPKVKRRESRHE